MAAPPPPFPQPPTDGVSVTHAREAAAERALHAARTLGVGVYLGRPVTFRWEGDGVRVRLRVGRGDVFVIPAGVPHTAAWDGPMEFLLLTVEAPLLAAVALEAELPASARPRPAFGVRDPFLAHALPAFADALRPRAAPAHAVPAARLFAATLGRAVALHVLRGYGDPPTAGGAAGPLLLPRRVRRVADYVRAHVGTPAGEDLSLARLAAEAGVSPSHLAHAFRRSTGESVHAFVARTRLDEAARLLRETRWPVGRVALALGYASPSHFAHAFRRHTGRTPRAHRDAPQDAGDGAA
jgi:AraC family transcriptional regulator